LRSFVHVGLVLREQLGVDSDLRRSKSRGGDKLQGRVSDELAGEPQEGLFEVIVGLGRDIVVLEVLLAVEGDGLGLDLALLYVDFVSSEDDGDVLADANEITCGVR